MERLNFLSYDGVVNQILFWRI